MGTGGKWPQRMKISEESFTLMLKFLIAGHMKKLPAIRRKIEKQALEDASLLCALVLALVREVKESYPVPDAALQDFIDTFVSGGDFGLELQLQAAIQEKTSTFGPSEVPQLQVLAQQLVQCSDERVLGAGQTQVMAAQLEASEFQLMLDKLRFDTGAYGVWRTKCLDREASRYFQNLNYKAQRHQVANNAARSLLDFRHINRKLTFAALPKAPADAALEIHHLIEDHLRTVQQSHQLASVSDVVPRLHCARCSVCVWVTIQVYLTSLSQTALA